MTDHDWRQRVFDAAATVLASPKTCSKITDAVLPILHAAVAEARADTAEAIVREIEITEHRCGDCGVLLDGTHIADIARQHKDQP